MLRIGKMKGRFEESKGWNLPNNLYIKGIYSTLFVILKVSVLPSTLTWPGWGIYRSVELPVEITCV